MIISDLKSGGNIILECISGSRAYGLDTPFSDTDIKGVFLLSKKDFYGLNYVPQVSNETNDIVYYELLRFLELLLQNNPNILELLSTPGEAILYKHPFLSEIQPEIFLSKLCKDTFGNFALSQIKKAKGLKKKIVNPLDRERKNILAFCFVNHAQGAIPLLKFLEMQQWKQEDCGLVNIPHMKDMYGLYHNAAGGYRGIMKDECSNEVTLSSIPKNREQVALLYFNKDGYSAYCKEYKEYWEWVERRNEARYQNTLSHGKKYDAKNMMHTFRLLEMAIEIAREGQVNVRRPEREFLLAIKNGEYEFEELLRMAEAKQIEMELAFANSTLPETPDVKQVNRLAFELRERFYTDQ